MRRIILVVLAVASFSVMADANKEGKEFAKSINAKLESSTKNTDPTIVPRYEGTNVEATQYYDSGLGIEDQAREKAQDDPTAQFMYEGHNSRPKIVFDTATDPLFKRLDEIDKKATSLLDTYDGCSELPVGEEDKEIQENKSCTILSEKYRASTTCTVNRNARCALDSFKSGVAKNVSLYTRWKAGMWGGGKGGCKTDDQYADITVNLITKAYSFNPEKAGGCYNSDHKAAMQSVTVSGIPSASEINKLCEDNPNVVLASHTFGNGGRYLTVLQMPSCQNGMVAKFRYYANVSSSMTPALTMNFAIETKDRCDIVIDETYSCAPTPNRTGTMTSSQCLISGSRPVQGGVSVNECWERREVYEWDASRVTDDSQCKALRDQGCGFVGSVCTNSVDGFCLNETQSYSCSALTSARTVMLCGSNLVCPDGECTSDIGQSYEPATEDFKRAAASMAVAQEIADQVDVENMTVFSGKALECQNKTLGMSNCCKDSGWLQGIGVAQCDAEEKELGMAKEAKQTVYVGSYESGSFLDKREYKAYCSYPSKLARILVQQGRPQLGLGFGSAKNPNCAGFTLEQLERLKFDRIDLSEFYGDVMEKAGQHTIDPNELAEALKQRFGGTQ